VAQLNVHLHDSSLKTLLISIQYFSYQFINKLTIQLKSHKMEYEKFLAKNYSSLIMDPFLFQGLNPVCAHSRRTKWIENHSWNNEKPCRGEGFQQNTQTKDGQSWPILNGINTITKLNTQNPPIARNPLVDFVYLARKARLITKPNYGKPDPLIWLNRDFS